MEVGWGFYLCREKSLRAASPLVCLPCGLPGPEWQPWLCSHSNERHLQFHSLLPPWLTKAASICYPNKAFLLFEVQVCIWSLWLQSKAVVGTQWDVNNRVQNGGVIRFALPEKLTIHFIIEFQETSLLNLLFYFGSKWSYLTKGLNNKYLYANLPFIINSPLQSLGITVACCASASFWAVL